MYILKYPYRKILQPLSYKLGWLHPDVVSYLAVVAAAVTGWCFYDSVNTPFLLIVAIILILVRMTLNTLDGVLAIRRGNLSLKGEIVNALPDRYSDILMLVGISLSPLCRDWLGIAAVSTIFLVSYTGMLGKALAVSWQHHGPMGKVERLVLIMIFALIQFIVLPETRNVAWFGITATPLEWAMGIIVLLGQVTVFRRLTGQLREIRCKEADERIDAERNRGRALVVYDSASGNTEMIAEQIARGLGCEVKSVSEAESLKGYEMVVLGTPNIRAKPTLKMQKYLVSCEDKPASVATFVTYGMPVLGRLTSVFCMKTMAGAWRIRSNDGFICPGFHVKYKTYKGRPNGADMEKAYVFGLKLSGKLSRARKGGR